MNSNEKTKYIVTINGTQKFLIVPCDDDIDTLMNHWIENGTKVHGDELRYHTITGDVLRETGNSAIIILKNAATLMWKEAVPAGDNWIEV